MKEEINLLPPGELRARVRRLYSQRISALGWAIAIGLGMMTATYGSVYGIEYVLYRDIQRELRTADGNTAELKSQIQQANSLLAAISSATATQVLWTETVDDVLAAAPSDIVVVSLGVKESAVGVSGAAGTQSQVTPAGALVINGRSSSRTAIVEYERRLQQLSFVKKVEAPLQNLAGGAANTFSFTVYQ